MIHKEIDLDGWWRISLYFMPSEDDMSEVIGAYRGIGCPEGDIAEISRVFPKDLNKGVTYSSGYLRHSVTIIGRAESWAELFNTVLHETKHLVDDITWWYDVLNYGEPPAYLQGEIGRQMAPAIKRIACPCCGAEKE